MRPDRDPAWENGQEAAVHAGSYGLTPQMAGAAGREPGAGRGVAGLGWPSAAAGGRLHHPAGDRARPGGRANTRGWFAWPAFWPTPSAWPPSGRSCPSRTTPARWSRRSAARTSPGWSAGSPRLSSTCSWSPCRPAPPAMTGRSPRLPDSHRPYLRPAALAGPGPGGQGLPARPGHRPDGGPAITI